AAVRDTGASSDAATAPGSRGAARGAPGETRASSRRSTRLIVEAGNSLAPNEYALMWSASWQDKYCEAIVDALEEVFGKFKSGGGTKPAPKPEVDPNKGKPRTFTLRFETPLRTSPGFWDYDKNESNVIKNLPAGVTGEIIEGPKRVDGVEFYDVRIKGQGVDGTGWLQDQVLHTLEIKG